MKRKTAGYFIIKPVRWNKELLIKNVFSYLHIIKRGYCDKILNSIPL